MTPLGITTYVTVAKAAELLGTTPYDVAQLAESGALEARDEDRLLISTRSVIARKKDGQ